MEYRPEKLPSIAELYGNQAPEGDMSKMRADAKEKKEHLKKVSAGNPPTLTWQWNNHQVKANTKGEARSEMKKLGINLPIGTKLVKLPLV